MNLAKVYNIKRIYKEIILKLLVKKYKKAVFMEQIIRLIKIQEVQKMLKKNRK
jgi:hypothetical protein